MTTGARPSRAAKPALGEPILDVTNLSVRFHTETSTVLAVDAVDLEVEAGEIVGIVGESGCGKSVTSMSLTGLLPRSASITGTASLAGIPLVGARGKALRRLRGKEIAYIFQEPMNSLNPVMTVGSQIVEALREHLDLSKAEARKRAIDLLRLVNIPSAEIRFDQYPHQLSGGMRQRVMIAMAVACEPKLLVADEPTTALDVTVQAGILDVLRELRARLGTSILIITHDLGVIADVADRVVVMYAGRVVEQADVDELFARPMHRYTFGLLGASPTPDTHSGEARLSEIPGLVPVLEDSPNRCTFVERCPAAVERCAAERPPLREVPTAAGGLHAVACWNPVDEAALAARPSRSNVGAPPTPRADEEGPQ